MSVECDNTHCCGKCNNRINHENEGDILSHDSGVCINENKRQLELKEWFEAATKIDDMQLNMHHFNGISSYTYRVLKDGKQYDIEVYYEPNKGYTYFEPVLWSNGPELEWTKEYDEYNNSVYILNSPYIDECGCAEFQFKISKKLEDDKIIFYESSDDELIIDNERRNWTTLSQAKQDMENDYWDIIQTCKEDSLYE